MSRVQSPDASFQLDEGTALQRLQNGLELGLSISKPTASARSAEILDAIDQMELKFPMLTSEGAEGRVETLINTILQAVGDLPVGRRKSSGWLKESLIPLCTNCIQEGWCGFRPRRDPISKHAFSRAGRSSGTSTPGSTGTNGEEMGTET